VVRESFEPKIVGFLCNWCCYAAADSAGVARFQYRTGYLWVVDNLANVITRLVITMP